ncbi:phosphotransferase family protein [Paenibacillus wenxiniae]|uniref:Phosphotransferase family protein n=1 Tax=Paenibacillus wenxiniae TaxID=1636843 RepID=A0ABW4RNH8_9BACL
MKPTNLDWTQLVRPNGQLNREMTSHIEILYTGLHGQSVQRFRLKDGNRYIYKPLPPGDDRFREIQAYLQVMPLLSELAQPPAYPALIAYAAPAEQLDILHESMLASVAAVEESMVVLSHPVGWIVTEDIGVLEHRHSSAVLEQVIDQMAGWHTVAAHHLTRLPQTGQKPPLPIASSSLLERWEQVQAVMQEIALSIHASAAHANDTFPSCCEPLPHVSEQLLLALQHHIYEATERIAAQPSVLLHGDLHAGNYGVNPQGTMIILDWEHSHAGSLFWDLYHLIDLSHPLFPREMTAELRHSLLKRYWVASGSGKAIAATHSQRYPVVLRAYNTFAEFEKDYLLYAIIYSIWMLLLIQNDLRQQPPIWPHALLLAQQAETQQHMEQCLAVWQDTYPAE